MAAKRNAPTALPEQDSPTSRVDLALLLAAVFSAGVASLVYEVVWIRQLGLSLGSTAVAFSVMLSAFLGGLALGGWYMGRRADDVPDPSRTLVRVEIAAAVLGVLSIPALAVAGRVYVWVAVTTSGGPLLSLLLRSMIALLVMLAPATLFGMTFPLATVIGGRIASGTTAAGAVAAASSFGSAAGALIAGLWLEPAFGLTISAAIGAGFNLVAALFVWRVSRTRLDVCTPQISSTVSTE
jgi:predicted membrane-bound spermidine synthase